MARGLTDARNLTDSLGPNQSLAGLVHTYDSGGQLPLPGVMVGNEDINVGVAPDNDPADLGLDIFANVANGVGPQVDGQGLGAYLDLDTNTENDGLFLAGIDDNDAGNGSDLAILGQSGRTADDGILAVHLSGIGEHAVDGIGDVADIGSLLGDGGLGNVGGLESLGSDQSLGGLVHTYDSGGQLPLPGVMVGNEDINVGVAPDNDPADLGVDIYANVANGVGPQADGQGLGAYLDLDTNTANPGFFLAGIDDNDSGYGSDLAILGQAGQTADDGYLAVHLSGIGDHAVDGIGDIADTGSLVGDGGLGNIGGLESIIDFDHV